MPPKKPYSFKQFAKDYPDEDACLEAFFKVRFGKLRCCPHCGVEAAQFYRVKGRRCFACIHCRHQLYPTAHTPLHRSTTPLSVWFHAMYLFSVSKNGVSSRELWRTLGVTYKTAWRIAKQLRTGLKQERVQLFGVVEADEAYIGGRRRSSSRFANKVPLLGAVERKGRLRVQAVDTASSKRVTDFLYDNVAPRTTLHTDESNLYKRSSKVYDRISVKHGRFEFVRGDAYTNTIEGFWGLFKPYLAGTHRSVSRQHLQTYVDEAVWKYNHRGQVNLFPALLQAVARRL